MSGARGERASDSGQSPQPEGAATAELEALRRKCRRLELLYRANRIIHSTLDSEKAPALIMEEAARLTGAVSGLASLLNPPTERLEILASHKLSREAFGGFSRRRRGGVYAFFPVCWEEG